MQDFPRKFRTLSAIPLLSVAVLILPMGGCDSEGAPSKAGSIDIVKANEKAAENAGSNADSPGAAARGASTDRNGGGAGGRGGRGGR